MPLAHGRFLFFFFERPPYLTESRKKPTIFSLIGSKSIVIPVYTHARVLTHTHTRTHTCTHACVRAHTHTHGLAHHNYAVNYKYLTLTPPYRSIFPLSPMILTSFIRNENFIEWAEFRTFILIFLAWRKGYFKQAWSTPVSMRHIP